MLSMNRLARTRFLRTCELIRQGRLRVITPEGHVHDFGTDGPEAQLEIHDWRLMTRVAIRGDVGFGEGYVDRMWDSPCIETLAQVATLNTDEFAGRDRPGLPAQILFSLSDGLMRANTLAGSRRNIRAHYDVGNEFYQLWLDNSMTYSSALFDDGGPVGLEDAQHRKNDRILSKFDESGSILEIGCGWGGFAERAADRDHQVTGITLSPSQKGYADARLDGRTKIELRDYRHVEGKYDNIVSIEMIEAVGRRFWPTYFRTVKERLSDKGKAVVQAILVQDKDFEAYAKGTDYVRRHVFPGGFLPSDGKIHDQARAAGLEVRERFLFGRSYAETCRRWAANLDAVRDKVVTQGYDDSFVRAWHYYLSICAATFAVGRNEVAQYELVHA